MPRHVFSRRRLLGGLLFGLAAWLCPKPCRAAAPRHPSPDATHSNGQLASITSYGYDCGEATEITCARYVYVYNSESRLIRYEETHLFPPRR